MHESQSHRNAMFAEGKVRIIERTGARVLKFFAFIPELDMIRLRTGYCRCDSTILDAEVRDALLLKVLNPAGKRRLASHFPQKLPVDHMDKLSLVFPCLRAWMLKRFGFISQNSRAISRRAQTRHEFLAPSPAFPAKAISLSKAFKDVVISAMGFAQCAPTGHTFLGRVPFS